VENEMLALQTACRARAPARDDGWVADVARRIPFCSSTHASNALDAVLGALLANLPASDIDKLADGVGVVMRPRLDAIRASKNVSDIAHDESLVTAVSARLPPRFPHHACLVTRVVLQVIAGHADRDVVSRIIASTPSRWRKLWPQSSWSHVAHA
jgi:uncharacterized protein (DUF2267 family)